MRDLARTRPVFEGRSHEEEPFHGRAERVRVASSRGRAPGPGDLPEDGCFGADGVGADYATKRRMLEIVCLNCRMDGVTLVRTVRKPLDVLAEAFDLSKSRGNRTQVELFDAHISLWGLETRLLLSL